MTEIKGYKKVLDEILYQKKAHAAIQILCERPNGAVHPISICPQLGGGVIVQKI